MITTNLHIFAMWTLFNTLYLRCIYCQYTSNKKNTENEALHIHQKNTGILHIYVNLYHKFGKLEHV